ncbi:bromodomain-containing protein 4-like [Quercus lobata]|uniref:bromodomain-containing protein 4-like n=1 Tax=Quercus lobata TaxID=97700 RepID=UPI001247C716|nr:bromodomain-containing protein 4-like [Quercus lobata]
MGLKRMPSTPLLELLEGQPGKDTPGMPQPNTPSPPPQPQIIQTRSSSSKSQPQPPRPKLPSSPPPALPPRPESTDSKRKRSPKGKETVDGGKSQPSKERDEAPRTKQLKIGHQSKGKETEVQPSQGKGKGIEAQSSPSAWLPAPMPHGGPLLETASMRDLRDGEGGFVADALGRTLLLPTDIDELKKMRMQEVFLSTKRMEEEVNLKSAAAENERSKRLLAARTLQASEEDLVKTKTALTDAIRERDNVSAGLASAQKQAEDQTKRLLKAKDQLRVARELIDDLNRRLAKAEHDKGVAEYARDEATRAKQEAEFARNEVEAAKETAEDDGYNAGVWEETLRRAGVNTSSDLWKAENIFYPTAIREATSTSSAAVSDQSEKEVTQSEAVQVGASPDEQLKEGEFQDVIEASQRTDPEGTDAVPAQPSPEGTALKGTEANPVPPSQDVADEKLKK